MKPVAAQCKFDTEREWSPCSVEHHNLVQSQPEKWPTYNTRLLYTLPDVVKECIMALYEDDGATHHEELLKQHFGITHAD
jgi:hypothetical protein